MNGRGAPGLRLAVESMVRAYREAHEMTDAEAAAMVEHIIEAVEAMERPNNG